MAILAKSKSLLCYYIFTMVFLEQCVHKDLFDLLNLKAALSCYIKFTIQSIVKIKTQTYLYKYIYPHRLHIYIYSLEKMCHEKRKEDQLKTVRNDRTLLARYRSHVSVNYNTYTAWNSCMWREINSWRSQCPTRNQLYSFSRYSFSHLYRLRRFFNSMSFRAARARRHTHIDAEPLTPPHSPAADKPLSWPRAYGPSALYARRTRIFDRTLSIYCESPSSESVGTCVRERARKRERETMLSRSPRGGLYVRVVANCAKCAFSATVSANECFFFLRGGKERKEGGERARRERSMNVLSRRSGTLRSKGRRLTIY